MAFPPPISSREKELLSFAVEKRQPLMEMTTALRLVNGGGDQLPGWTLDQFGELCQLQFFSEREWERRAAWAEAVVHLLNPRGVVLKNRTAADGASLDRFQPEWWKSDSVQKGKTIVREGRARFAVDLSDGVNPGLFLDMRHHRLRFAEEMKGRRLLNLFAYTGSFGVHSLLAGAANAIQVDYSQKILDRARLNLRINGFRADRKELLRWEAREYLQFAEKKRFRFDAIVLDPPTFAQQKGKSFRVVQALPQMLLSSMKIIERDGRLLVGTNCSSLSIQQLQRLIEESALQTGRSLRLLFSGGQDCDFPLNRGAKESHLAVVAVCVD